MFGMKQVCWVGFLLVLAVSACGEDEETVATCDPNDAPTSVPTVADEPAICSEASETSSEQTGAGAPLPPLPGVPDGYDWMNEIETNFAAITEGVAAYVSASSAGDCHLPPGMLDPQESFFTPVEATCCSAGGLGGPDTNGDNLCEVNGGMNMFCSDDTWRAIGFAPDTPHAFTYGLEPYDYYPDESDWVFSWGLVPGFTLYAYGDPECDGVPVVYSQVVEFDQFNLETEYAAACGCDAWDDTNCLQECASGLRMTKWLNECAELIRSDSTSLANCLAVCSSDDADCANACAECHSVVVDQCSYLGLEPIPDWPLPCDLNTEVLENSWAEAPREIRLETIPSGYDLNEELETNFGAILSGARAAYEASPSGDCQFPSNQGLTPVEATCCSSSGLGGPDTNGNNLCDIDPEMWTWESEDYPRSWDEIGFAGPEGEHHAVYGFRSSGDLFEVYAWASPGCDGEHLEFSQHIDLSKLTFEGDSCVPAGGADAWAAATSEQSTETPLLDPAR